MFGVTISDDYRPVAWMGRYPVDVTTMLVGLHVAAAILTAILVMIGAHSFLAYLQFDSAAVWAGQVWRLFTYAFVHSPSALLWFAIEMYMLFVFGREVERFIGRRAYITLYIILLVAPAVLLTIWGFWQRSVLSLASGSSALHFGIFVAFATIYPRAELFLRIMRYAGAKGCTIFDFGRSKEGTGPYNFKRHWGFEPMALPYWYYAPNGQALPDTSPLNPKLQWAIRIWRGLPLAITNSLGPHIVRHIP